MPDNEDKLVPSYPALTIDTLAFTIANDILYDPNNHDEFDVHETDYDALVEAIGDDMQDLIHNGNEDDWLLCFYDNDGRADAIGPVSAQLDAILHRTYDRETGEGQTDIGRYNAAIQEVAEKAATIILKVREGIPGRFGFAE
jgi:hypothetical protein